MNLINPSPEQVTEIAARSTYLLSNLIAWIEMNKEWPSADTEKQIEKWTTRIQMYLQGIGGLEFQSLKEMIAELSIKNYDTNKAIL